MNVELKNIINLSIEIYYKKNYEWYVKIFNDKKIIINSKNINKYNKK